MGSDGFYCSGGACLVRDNDDLAYRVSGTISGVKVLGLLIEIFVSPRDFSPILHFGSSSQGAQIDALGRTMKWSFLFVDFLESEEVGIWRNRTGDHVVTRRGPACLHRNRGQIDNATSPCPFFNYFSVIFSVGPCVVFQVFFEWHRNNVKHARLVQIVWILCCKTSQGRRCIKRHCPYWRE